MKTILVSLLFFFSITISYAQCGLSVVLNYTIDSTTCIYYFDLDVAGTPPYEFTWDLAYGRESIAQNPYLFLHESGVPTTVSVLVTDANGCDTTISMTFDYLDCIGYTATCYTDFSVRYLSCHHMLFMPIVSEPSSWYEWDFGDGTISNSIGLVHGFADSIAYTVTLNVATAGGTLICMPVTKIIDVCPPVCDIAGQMQFTSDSCIYEFEGLATGSYGPYTYEWDFGNGLTSSNQNDTVYFLNGSHPVSLIITDSIGCETTVLDTITASCSFADISSAIGDYKIYPNPVSDVLIIEQSQYKSIAEIVIVDVSGRTLLISNGSDDTFVQLDISSLMPGIYTIYIKSSTNVTSERILKL